MTMNMLEVWRPRSCGFKIKKRERKKNNIQVMTSNSHNENQSLLQISKLAFFHWYPHLRAPECDVSFKNSALRKAVGNTNTATGGH